jgi:hypothetical protein
VVLYSEFGQNLPNDDGYEEWGVELYDLATKKGTKFEDLNANGFREDGEPGLPGWIIYADINGNEVRDPGEPYGETDANGDYTIEQIPLGPVTIREEQQPGWFCSFPSPCYYEEFFAAEEVKEGNDFGNYQYAKKSGYKWHDLNADGVWDAGEPGLEDWVIELWDGSGKIAEAMTGADGYYEFADLEPGDYAVCEQLQTDWLQSFPGDDEFACPGGLGLGAYGYAFTLTSGQHEEDNNFGNYMYATKSGYKWNDLLDDGEWDQVNEPALPGWTIELWDVTGTPVPAASTTTDGNGAYAFSGLMPGKTYAVCEVLNAFYVQTFPSASTPDPDPPKEVIFDCTVLGANYGPFGYQFYAESGDEFTLNNFGNMEPQGCTYTQGYWKTHSIDGPAAHPDDGWYTTFGPYPPGVDGPEGPILDGPDAPLFGSGLTWLEAFNHPPRRATPGSSWRTSGWLPT